MIVLSFSFPLFPFQNLSSSLLPSLSPLSLPRNMLAPLLSFLLKPKPYIQRDVDNFLSQHVKGRRLIGVQMRTTEKYADEDLLSIYGECISLVSRNFSNEVIFVSTDSVTARDMLIQRFGSDRVIFHRDETIEMSHNCGRYRTTVLHGIKDILTLARCDEMVVTCGSSFSRVAVGLARKPPIVVSGMCAHVCV